MPRQNAIEGYEMDLDKLRAYAEKHQLDFVHMDFEGLQDFIFEQFKDLRSEATQARVLAGIHSWFRFLLYKDYIDQDPSELLEGPKKPKHLPTVLSLDEVNRMMAAIDLSSNEGHRNRAMMEMLYGSGLRVSELVTLQLSKIYLNEHYSLSTFASISDISLSRDNAYATLYVSCLVDKDLDNSVKALQSAAAFIQGRLAKVMKTKNTPRLTFVADTTERDAAKMDALLESLNISPAEDTSEN